MCTSVVYKTKNTYFGRNLDLEYSYDETITITPRKFPFEFRDKRTIRSHFAIIGVAFVVPDKSGKDYPLYYDAINERGLGITGLHFEGSAKYFPKQHGKDNITPFEFIPWILSQCSNIKEAKAMIARMNFLKENFSTKLPLAPLHWHIADAKGASITVESTADGIHVYDNPVGVLTNNPPFPAQLFSLNNYMHLSTTDPTNTFAPNLGLYHYSRGMGGIGLPGDYSSNSRFIRACFVRAHSSSDEDESSSLSQYFHIQESVAQPNGATEVKKNKFETTIYTSCYNLQKGLCYYTTYGNHQISCIDMHKSDLDSKTLVSFPLISSEQINHQN